jgi:hypothetical protein
MTMLVTDRRPPHGADRFRSSTSASARIHTSRRHDEPE